MHHTLAEFAARVWVHAAGRKLAAGLAASAEARTSHATTSTRTPGASRLKRRGRNPGGAAVPPHPGVAHLSPSGAAATAFSRRSLSVVPEESFHSLSPFALRPSRIAAAADGDLKT